jgi:hypothetical protein
MVSRERKHNPTQLHGSPAEARVVCSKCWCATKTAAAARQTAVMAPTWHQQVMPARRLQPVQYYHSPLPLLQAYVQLRH